MKIQRVFTITNLNPTPQSVHQLSECEDKNLSTINEFKIVSNKFHCIAKNCDESKNIRNSFHHLPRNKEIRDKWLINVNRQDLINTKCFSHRVICGAHFKNSQYRHPTSKMLNAGEIPFQDGNSADVISKCSEDNANPIITNIKCQNITSQKIENKAETSIKATYNKKGPTQPKHICIVNGCDQKNNTRNLFHSLPKDDELRQNWLILINRIDLIKKSYDELKDIKVCGAHFYDSDYIECIDTKMNENIVTLENAISSTNNASNKTLENSPQIEHNYICIVKGCDQTKNTKRIFHHLPENDELRKKWLIKIRRNDLVDKDYSYFSRFKICGLHFRNSEKRSDKCTASFNENVSNIKKEVNTTKDLDMSLILEVDSVCGGNTSPLRCSDEKLTQTTNCYYKKRQNHCIVKNCDKKKNIRNLYHSLPIDDTLRNKWLTNVKRDDLIDKKYDDLKKLKICGAHFDQSQYTGKHCALSRVAIPYNLNKDINSQSDIITQQNNITNYNILDSQQNETTDVFSLINHEAIPFVLLDKSNDLFVQTYSESKLCIVKNCNQENSKRVFFQSLPTNNDLRKKLLIDIDRLDLMENESFQNFFLCGTHFEEIQSKYKVSSKGSKSSTNSNKFQVNIDYDTLKQNEIVNVETVGNTSPLRCNDQKLHSTTRVYNKKRKQLLLEDNSITNSKRGLRSGSITLQKANDNEVRNFKIIII